MISGPVRYVVLGALLAALMVLGGCAYTVTTVEVDPPKLGPPVKTGQAAVMDQVIDKRTWPSEASDKRIPNVRIFAPDMTKLLREEFTQRGLFTALPAPDTPAAENTKAELKVTVRSFALQDSGKNAWLVPHLLMDGFFLPVFTVAMVGTGGEIDLGGYVFPSTVMAINLKASLSWKDPCCGKAILTRDYLLDMPLGGVSDREFKQEMGDARTHGVRVGKEAGLEALTNLANEVSRDPHWAFLKEYRSLAIAEAMFKRYGGVPPPKPAAVAAMEAETREWPSPYRSFTPSTEARVDTFRNVKPPPPTRAKAAGPSVALGQMVTQVRSLLYILKPLAYTPNEVNIITDGNVLPDQRAAIVNDIRAQELGLDNPEDLPAGQFLDEQAAIELYDSPAVARAQVEAELVERVLKLAVDVLTPRTEAPSAQAKALRQGLINDLAAKLKDKPKLQVLLLEKADLAVRQSWPPMQELLKLVGSPMTQRYLASRTD